MFQQFYDWTLDVTRCFKMSLKKTAKVIELEIRNLSMVEFAGKSIDATLELRLLLGTQLKTADVFVSLLQQNVFLRSFT